MASSDLKPLNVSSTKEFDSLVVDNTYVLLDFTASWCPPCKMIAPIFEQLSVKNSVPGSLAFAKIDVDEQQEIASRYGITAMPTFILLKKGEVSETVRGANPPAIQNLVKGAVAGLEASKAAQPAEAKKDEETVSGSYTVSSNADWKTSL